LSEDDVGALADQLRRRLIHEQQVSGRAYVRAGAPPPPLESGNGPAPTSAGEAREVASAGATASKSPIEGREDVASLQKRVRREQARAWPAAKKLEFLQAKSVGDCQRCPLSRTRTNIVFGVGDPEADIMFVGEAPGAEEDREGEPFVGAAGRRLDQWIEAIGLQRSQVYIANVLKCRPPRNRDPHPREIETCSPFLRAQIRAVQPKTLITLGRFAGNLVLGGSLKLYEMRRGSHVYEQADAGIRIPVVATYHPAYILRREREPSQGAAKNSDGRKSAEEIVLDDLRRALRIARGEPT
jgi:DNA polymerase